MSRAHVLCIPITGCSINPTRSFGPAFISGVTSRGLELQSSPALPPLSCPPSSLLPSLLSPALPPHPSPSLLSPRPPSSLLPSLLSPALPPLSCPPSSLLAPRPSPLAPRPSTPRSSSSRSRRRGRTTGSGGLGRFPGLRSPRWFGCFSSSSMMSRASQRIRGRAPHRAARPTCGPSSQARPSYENTCTAVPMCHEYTP